MLAATAVTARAQSPYESSADFANYAMKLREQAMLKVEPQVFVPHLLAHLDPALPVENEHRHDRLLDRRAADREQPGAEHEKFLGRQLGQQLRRLRHPGLVPAPQLHPGQISSPRQNPFYVALPYNDVTRGQFKPEAALVIPWFKQANTPVAGESVCKGRWVAVRKGNRVAYAQWEDCGPFRTDHFQYVFQNERPKPNLNRGAGLDVSPAVRDYLGLQSTDVTDWQFVEVRDVPAGTLA